MIRTLPRGRRAYTLVELLVVISLIILLAAIVAGIGQMGFFDSQRVVSAADRVSGWLLISKMRAVRDQAPRGLRFQLTPANATRQETVGHVQEMQYIEQPEVWVPNPGRNPQGAALVFATVTVPQPAPPSPPGLVPGAVIEQWAYFVTNDPILLSDFDQRVTVGDYVVVPEHAASYKITAILNPNPALSLPGGSPLVYHPIELYGALVNPASVRQLVLSTSPYRAFPANPYTVAERPEPDLGASGLPLDATHQPPGFASAPFPRRATKVTHDFGFQGAPRPLLGEPLLTLTANTIVDVRAPLFGQAGIGPNGYRDLSNPVAGGPNGPPYWPTTSSGFQLQNDNLGQVHFDILFAPSGQVLNNPNSLIALWIRDPEKVNHPRLGDAPPLNPIATWGAGTPALLDRPQEFDEAGEQLLVVVYTKTGMIAAHPIVPPPATPTPFYDPYRFAKDGANSGL